MAYSLPRYTAHHYNPVLHTCDRSHNGHPQQPFLGQIVYFVDVSVRGCTVHLYSLLIMSVSFDVLDFPVLV